MAFTKSQDARKDVECTEIIHARRVDELHAHLAGNTKLKLHKLTLRRRAEWIVEQARPLPYALSLTFDLSALPGKTVTFLVMDSDPATYFSTPRISRASQRRSA
jgi:hypothetical protein